MTTDLQYVIDQFGAEFDIEINNTLIDDRVFIEIIHKETKAFHNMDVADGWEVEGLMMVIAEWELMCGWVEWGDSIH